MVLFVPLQVSLRIEPEVQRPGMDATIFVEAQGSSIIGLSGVDKSLLYLAGTNDITNARVGTQLGTQLANIVGPPTARQRYATQKRIAGGLLMVRCCVLAGRPLEAEDHTWASSLENLNLFHAFNKDANTPIYLCNLISTFSVRSLESTID